VAISWTIKVFDIVYAQRNHEGTVKLSCIVSLADMLRYLDYLNLKHPELVEMLTIGTSSLGKPLKVIKISTGQTKNGEIKPAVWIDGGEFSRLRLLQCCPALGFYGQFRNSLVTRPSFLPVSILARLNCIKS
jgi:hypothetical protein